MESLQSTKNRIKLVSSIKKTTHAMQMIAIAKMRRTKTIFNNINPYNQEMVSTFEKIINKLDQIDFEKVFALNTSKISLHIIITSDLGMAGTYNSNILKLARSAIKKNDLVIVLGHKGINFFKEKKWESNLLEYFSFPSEDIDYSIIREITKKAMKMYNENQIGKIKVIYTDFINNIVQKETIKTIFPIEYTKNVSKDFETIEIEPSPYEVLTSAFPLYISNYIYTCCIVSKLSENASRRMSMENATNNASDIIDKLKLELNRKRQSIITQELNEIISGAEAI
ncbi:ATP synthase F1 subunit gamma [Mycoplasmopsis hyopharyngis]|uniref:ATP synthase F1 subunit gamma n=1 Tax=Mycoplasmopsis hyopharyngis TaxID=29558 RepID=UPI003873AEBE